MKEPLRISGVFRRVEHSLTSGLFGFVVAVALSRDVRVAVVMTVPLAVLGFLGRDPILLVLAFAGSLGSIAVFVAVNELIIPNYRLSGLALTRAAGVLTLGFLILLSRFAPKRSVSVPFLGLGVYAAVYLVPTWNWIFAKPFEHLSFLARTDSSYSEFLASLSQSFTAGQTQLVPTSSGSAGPLLGTVLVVVRTIISWLDSNSLIDRYDHATVIVQILIITTLLISGVWTWICAECAQKFNYQYRSILCAAAGLGSALFSFGLVRIGRLDVLISYLFISLGILTSSHLAKDNNSTKLARIVTSVLFLFAGFCWLPTIVFFVVFIGVMYLHLIFGSSTERTQDYLRWKIINLVFFGLFVLSSIFVLAMSSYWELTTLPSDGSQVGDAPGGTAAVYPWVMLLLMSVSIYFAIHVFVEKTLILVGVCLLTFVTVPSSVVALTYFVFPYQPEMSTWLLLYLSVAILAPLVFCLALTKVSNSQWSQNFKYLSGALVLGSLGTVLLPQWSSITILNFKNSEYELWSQRVILEYGESPDRPVMCLSQLTEDSSDSTSAQICTKMSLSMAGFISPPYDYLMNVLGCTNPNTDTAPMLSEEFFQNATAILPAPEHDFSVDGCQLRNKENPSGWLTLPEWEILRKIDINGTEVTQ